MLTVDKPIVAQKTQPLRRSTSPTVNQPDAELKHSAPSKAVLKLATGLRFIAGHHFDDKQFSELIGQLHRASKLSLRHAEKCADFVVHYFEDIGESQFHQKKAVGRSLQLLEVLVSALPLYPPHTDFPALKYSAKSYRNSPEKFSEIVGYHVKLAHTPSYEKLIIPYRLLIGLGIQNGESPIEITKALLQLASQPLLRDENNVDGVVDFLQGLVANNWDFAANIILFNDALLRQVDIVSTIELCALSTQLGKQEERNAYQRSVTTKISPTIEYLNLGPVSARELSLAIKVFKCIEETGLELNATSQKLFTLFEICRCNGTVAPERLYSRIEKEITAGNNPHDLIEIMIKNALLSIENLPTRRLIEKLICSNSLNEFKEHLEILRYVHGADVLDEERPTDLQGKLHYDRQLEILEDSMASFDICMQIRHALPLYASELVRFPDGHPGMLACFGDEVGKVENLHCSEGAYPGEGVIISQIDPTKVMQVDPFHIISPFHRYLTRHGWEISGIEDFASGRYIITEKLKILSFPGNKRYSIGGVEYSAVFFRDDFDNQGGNQCFYIPTSIIDEKLCGCSYDFLGLPANSHNLADLADRSFFPEDFAFAAQSKGMLYFDVGSATNIGGHSNSITPFKAEARLSSESLNALFAPQAPDAWGNQKKKYLLNDQQAFSRHSTIHDRLADMQRGFGMADAILMNRYTTWKQGRTPDNSLGDKAWTDPLPHALAGMRMALYAYRWHIHLNSLSARSTEFPHIKFWRPNQLQDGPVKNMFVDTENMRINLPDQVIQLPNFAKKAASIAAQASVDEFIVDKFSSLPQSFAPWNLHISPLEDLIPVLCFEDILDRR